MKKYKNSPKRFYPLNKIYFVTTNTWQRFPYCKEDIFCELFVEELLLCKYLKEFEIVAYKINPDHVHLLIKPCGEYNYSHIMKSLKENVSRDINKIINNHSNPHISDTSTCRLYGEAGLLRQKLDNIINRKDLTLKYKHPQFKWQRSF